MMSGAHRERILKFIDEYCVDLNKTRAAARAFGTRTSAGKKRSDFSLYSIAREILKKPWAQKQLKLRRAEHARACAISTRRTLREAAAIAFFDPYDVFEQGPGGVPQSRPWGDITPVARKAIAGVKIKRRRAVLGRGDEKTEWEIEELEYKFASKVEALEKLFKYLGLAKDNDAMNVVLDAIARHQQNTTAIPASGGDSCGGTKAAEEPQPPIEGLEPLS